MILDKSRALLTPSSKTYERMNLPEAMRNCKLAETPTSLRPTLENYLTKFREMWSDRIGLYFHGPAGVGKTSAAAMCLKQAARHGLSCYFTTVKDLKKSVMGSEQFDYETSTFSRCKSVEALVLDDLDQQMLEDKIFGYPHIEDLINYRNMDRKVTFVTSRLGPSVMRGYDGGALLSVFAGGMVSVPVVGPDKRPEQYRAMEKKVILK